MEKFTRKQLFIWKSLLDKLIPFGGKLYDNLEIVNIVPKKHNGTTVFSSRTIKLPKPTLTLSPEKPNLLFENVNIKDVKGDVFDLESDNWHTKLLGNPGQNSQGGFEYVDGLLCDYSSTCDEVIDTKVNEAEASQQLVITGLPSNEDEKEHVIDLLKGLLKGQPFDRNGKNWRLNANISIKIIPSGLVADSQLVDDHKQIPNIQFLLHTGKVAYIHVGTIESILYPSRVLALDDKAECRLDSDTKEILHGKLVQTEALCVAGEYDIAIISNDLSAVQRRQLSGWRQKYAKSRRIPMLSERVVSALLHSPITSNYNENPGLNLEKLIKKGGVFYSTDYKFIQDKLEKYIQVDKTNTKKWLILNINITTDNHDILESFYEPEKRNACHPVDYIPHCYQRQKVFDALLKGQNVFLSGYVHQELYYALQGIWHGSGTILVNGKPKIVPGKLLLNMSLPDYDLNQKSGLIGTISPETLIELYFEETAKKRELPLKEFLNIKIIRQLRSYINWLFSLPHHNSTGVPNKPYLSFEKLENSIHAIECSRSLKPYWLYEYDKNHGFIKLQILY